MRPVAICFTILLFVSGTVSAQNAIDTSAENTYARTIRQRADKIVTTLEIKDTKKKKIYDWLVEAREHAMDAESSDKKHAWFGKYKGRINNYLSAAGYDMNKEGKEWQARIKAQQAAGKN